MRAIALALVLTGCGGLDHGHGHVPSHRVSVLSVWCPPTLQDDCRSFYRNVLHLPEAAGHGTHHAFDADGTYVVLMDGRPTPASETTKRWPLFALRVDDLDAAIRDLRDAGVDLPRGIEPEGAGPGNSRYVMFHDPAGNLLELVEWS